MPVTDGTFKALIALATKRKQLKRERLSDRVAVRFLLSPRRLEKHFPGFSVSIVAALAFLSRLRDGERLSTALVD